MSEMINRGTGLLLIPMVILTVTVIPEPDKMGAERFLLFPSNGNCVTLYKPKILRCGRNYQKN